MIANIYIESAKNIRNEFLKLNTKLDSYQKELANLVIYLNDVSKELDSYADNKVSNIKNKSDITTVTDHIIKKFNEIEAEEQKLLRLVTPINEKIEKLKIEENFLFNEIRKKYPKMKDNEIIDEIQSNL